MDSYPPEAWERLGDILARRRGQLGYGYRQRRTFAEANGLKLSARTLQRLEQAERDAYPEETIGIAEVIYRLAPGSIAAVLRGGEPTYLDEEPDELRPECVYEEEVLSTPDIDESAKLQMVRVHRQRGHSARCRPEAETSGELKSALPVALSG